jgi:hypothetical protein
MWQLSLRCKDRRFQPGMWTLLVEDAGARLIDAAGATWAMFPHAQADGRVVFPSFWQSVKDLSVKSDTAGPIAFVPDRDTVAQMRTYVDSTLPVKGAGALRAMSRRGWLFFTGGLAGFAGAVVLGVRAAMHIYRTSLPPAGRVPIVLLLVSVGATYRGSVLLARARRARRALEGHAFGDPPR